jgi:hypothetical protein
MSLDDTLRANTLYNLQAARDQVTSAQANYSKMQRPAAGANAHTTDHTFYRKLAEIDALLAETKELINV